ncbi:DUF3084 domain-containing protein [Prochlorothrix hollandica]|uniref:DUF3084 domain-containing protein n=1 Tax=Prochlorothrix hollandica PCC 9006 = CALU 1027 TaxID=317619 RepID=A0A0M2PXT1_PROHO|nr:DUF3084 domain-containing protein [Prochlorothrix hollandica]KKI99473.1 hypothetical protein PROH_12800 [Prochlorothrix hollandica PCC 9006 = CALU 1027]
MAGYILVLSVLILGGVIATVGDRLGTKVGKARLSLFNLRPRDTAVVITILTGGVVSATTLGILFAVNKELRGIFQLEELESQRETAQAELEQVRQEKTAIEAALTQAQDQQREAQAQLTTINQSLDQAKERQATTEAQLKTVAGQATGLRQEAAMLQAEADELMQQRDRVQAQIEQRDREIQKQEALLAAGQAQIAKGQAQIAAGQTQIDQLETAQQFLAQEVQQLEQNYRLLQTGSVVLARGQVLSTAVIQSPSRQQSRDLLDQVLQQANQVAQQQIRPGTDSADEPVIQVPLAEVDRLIDELSNGQPSVVRVLAARNSVLGDSRVQVVLEVSPNRLIFQAGEVVANASTDPTQMDINQLRQRLDLLLAASQFRAERAGIVSEGVPLRVQTYVQFLEQLATQEQPLTIQAVTPMPIYTVGPLRLQFIALDRDNHEVFRSLEPASSLDPNGAGF